MFLPKGSTPFSTIVPATSFLSYNLLYWFSLQHSHLILIFHKFVGIYHLLNSTSYFHLTISTFQFLLPFFSEVSSEMGGKFLCSVCYLELETYKNLLIKVTQNKACPWRYALEWIFYHYQHFLRFQIFILLYYWIVFHLKELHTPEKLRVALRNKSKRINASNHNINECLYMFNQHW